MADVPSTLVSWSATASSNSPTDATTLGSGLADNLQAIQAVVRGDLASVGANIASSANPDVGAVQGLYHTVTGNNSIAGLGSTATAGIWKILEFAGTPPLIHSTALSLLGAATVQAAAGDIGLFLCQATSQWKMVSYFKAAISPDASATATTAGIVELATNAETLAGTDTTRAITPSALDAVLGLVKLNSGTFSATAVGDIAMTSYTAYPNKLLIISNFVPVTDGAGLSMQLSTDGGTTFNSAATDYEYVAESLSAPSTFTVTGSTGASSVALSDGVDNVTTAGGVNGRVVLYGTEDVDRTIVEYEMAHFNSADNAFIKSNGGGGANTSQNTDAVRLFFTTGNISIGDWALYGYNE